MLFAFRFAFTVYKHRKTEKMETKKIDNLASRAEHVARHAEVSEKVIEQYLTKQVQQLGGVCLKYANSNMVGYPDRVALLPGGVCFWVELKSAGRKPARIQCIRIKQLQDMGHRVYVVDSKKKVDDILKPFRHDL